MEIQNLRAPCDHVTIALADMLAEANFMGAGIADAVTAFRCLSHMWFDEHVGVNHDQDICDQFSYSLVVADRDASGDVFLLTVEDPAGDRWVFVSERGDTTEFSERWEHGWRSAVLLDSRLGSTGFDLRFVGEARWES